MSGGITVVANGIGASAGTYTGPVRIVSALSELSGLAEGDVLVVRASNPAWTIGMLRSGAIVTELGGPICHAAIVARELGIPAVVAVENVMSLLTPGMRVTVDGTAGTVRFPRLLLPHNEHLRRIPVTGQIAPPSVKAHTLPHLRVALFGNCNFRCTYCPPWGENSYEIGKNLSFAELETILRACAQAGFEAVKLTGGEPTLRHDVVRIVALACELFGEVRLITNGWRLPRSADRLAAAGLRIIEVSLDAAEETRFDEITQTSGQFGAVRSGLDCVRAAGISLQINMVVMRANIDQLIAMMDLAETIGDVALKLLELVYYEYQGHAFWQQNFVEMAELLPGALEQRGHILEWITPTGDFGSPMRLYRLEEQFDGAGEGRHRGLRLRQDLRGMSFFPCQDGLYGLTLTADGMLKMCKHRPDLHMPLRPSTRAPRRPMRTGSGRQSTRSRGVTRPPIIWSAVGVPRCPSSTRRAAALKQPRACCAGIATENAQ